ncbi:DNA recombination protein RmuC [Candidatus Parcubacteria bacterium]|nr:DNA recombination protein RmuC [Candidatus Parcubacteria bacterium]
MEIILIVLLLIILIGNSAFFYFYFKNKKEEKPQEEKEDKSMQLMLQQLNELSRSVNENLGLSRKEVQESLHHQSTQSQKIIQDVTEQLTKLDETNKQVLNFSDQIRDLQDTLTNPKRRGVLGEYYLEETLKNVFAPDSYKIQYKFDNGDIVDAALFIKDRVLPIDSKFPLENYQKFLDEKDPAKGAVHYKNFENDLKERIKETSKYIRPDEGTMEFAFMFIPSEAIYYDLLVNKHGEDNLIVFANKHKNVVIVSPTSFLAYLQTVLQGLNAMQIEESAKFIKKNVGVLQKHIDKYDDYMKKLGTQMGTTVNTYNSAYKEFKKIDKDVLRISEKGGNVEVLELDKPDVEE